MKIFAPLFLVLFLIPALAHADPLADGRDAYNNEDYPTALKILRPLAEDGDAEAQLYLGWMYREGQGVKQSDSEAFKWASKAAEQDNQAAQAVVSEMYADGKGTSKDIIQAYKWATIAETTDDDDAETVKEMAPVLGGLAKEMRPNEIEKAKRLANDWVSAHQTTHDSENFGKLFLEVFLLPAFCVAALPGRQQRFHYFHRAITWITFSMFLFTPLFLVLNQEIPPQSFDTPLMEAIGWAVAIVLILVYAGKRCSSREMSYLDGLMYVVASVSGIGKAIWGAAVVVVAVPMIAVMVVLSLFMALFNDLTGKSKLTPLHFQRMIGFVFKHRIDP